MKELKSCPFCGGEAELKYRAKLLGAWAVECGNKLCSLGYKVDDFPNEQDAIAAWNQRYEPTCEGHQCEETGEWVCHKCGGSLAGCMFDPVRDGFVSVPNFCPSCGAKVVE